MIKKTFRVDLTIYEWVNIAISLFYFCMNFYLIKVDKFYATSIHIKSNLLIEMTHLFYIKSFF